MATSIFINNRSTQVPGAYSTIDATGLAQVGLSASGIVALLGTAKGGLPYTAADGNADKLPRIGTPQQMKNLIAEGDLLEAAMMAFDPSSDPLVLGGAQIVIPVQVNPETQASAELPAASGDSIVVTALTYGTAGNDLTFKVAAGTASGVKVVVKKTSTGTTETYDNLATLQALTSRVTQASNLVSVAAAPGATDLPAATSSDQALAGGATSAADADDWQAALDLLRQARATIVVPLTSDAGILDKVRSHVDYMCGAGRSERQAFVGLANNDGTAPTKATILQRIQDLSSRNMQFSVEQPTKYDTKGALTTFGTPFMAATLAGMRCGAGLGEPLTHKLIKTLSLTRDRSWNSLDDAEQLIAGGALITERVEGLGFRTVRDITGYLSDNNLAFTEGSVNASINYAAYTLRTTLEFAVGRPGFAGTQNAVKAAAIAVLSQMVQANIIANYTTPTVTPVNDQFQVAVSLAPNLPVNFIPIAIHIVSPQALAA